MKTNPLATISGRAGLVKVGLGTVAGVALLLGAVVGLMLAGLAPEHVQPETTNAYRTAPPDTIAGLDPATVSAIETPDAPAQTPAQLGDTTESASPNVPATASIVDREPAEHSPAAVMSRPPLDRLPLDLGPRVAHALAALEPNGFVVQVGSYNNERDATALAAAVAGVAAPVRVTPFVDADGRGGWQVAAGPFPDAATATATAADIRRVVGLSPLIRSLELGE